jgi:hypothetical protein
MVRECGNVVVRGGRLRVTTPTAQWSRLTARIPRPEPELRVLRVCVLQMVETV